MKMLIGNIMNFKEADTRAHMLISEKDGAKLLIVGLHVVPPGGEIRPHIHPDQELAYIIINGKALITVGEKQAEVSQNDVIWIPIKTKHGAKNIGEEELRYIFTGWAV